MRVKKPVIISVIGVLVIIVLFVAFIEILSSHQTSLVIQNKDQKLRAIKNMWEDKIVKAVGVIDATSKLEEIQQKPDPTLIQTKLNGVPKDVGLEKRKIAQDILAGNSNFEDIGFMIPNGDVYVLEPYSNQQNLKTLNFAFRDYMVGALSAKTTYVSEVFHSQGTDKKTLAISAPVFSDGNITGVWVGALNLKFLQDEISRYALLGDPSRIILVDHNAKTVLDTMNDPNIDGFSSFAHLQSIHHALNNESGYIEEDISDAKMFSLYAPLHVGTHTWGVLLTQPHDEAFHSVDFFKNMFYLFTGLIIAVFVSLQYVTIRNNDRSKVTKNAQFPNKKYLGMAIVVMVAFAAYVLLDFDLKEELFGTKQGGILSKSDFEPKTRYHIENLRGDTVDTWLAWNIPEGRTLFVSILGQDTISDEKLDAIKQVLLSEDTVDIEDHLLHKGPQGEYSTYYIGWKGALEQVKQKPLAFNVPSNLEIMEPAKGVADITIKLVKYRDADGYSGYTNSVADKNQILKSTITIYDVERLSTTELETITRHELGHAFGLAHSTAPEDLMHPTIETNYPFISSCNLDAISALYDGKQSSQVVCEK